MKNKLKIGVYQHFKGRRYEVIGVGKDSETLEDVVVYRALYGENQIWVRPYEMFTEVIERDDKKIPRFEYLENEKIS